MKFLKKFFFLMSKYEQRKFFLLMFLILVVTFVDILGVVSIFPFLMILSNPEIIQTNKTFYYFYLKANILGINNFNEFIFFLGFSVLFLLLITLFLRALTSYLQVRFVTMREYEIGTRLFSRYIYQPYDFFLNRNIAPGILNTKESIEKANIKRRVSNKIAAIERVRNGTHNFLINKHTPTESERASTSLRMQGNRYGSLINRDEEYREKQSEKSKGNKNVRNKKWWNDGKQRKRSIECPGEGWKAGYKIN